jgi:hypothetical protein
VHSRTESRDAKRAGYWICLWNLDSKSAAVPAAPTLAVLSFPSLENLSYLVVKKRSLQWTESFRGSLLLFIIFRS